MSKDILSKLQRLGAKAPKSQPKWEDDEIEVQETDACEVEEEEDEAEEDQQDEDESDDESSDEDGEVAEGSKFTDEWDATIEQAKREIAAEDAVIDRAMRKILTALRDALSRAVAEELYE